tara:strand:- start:1379 stop:2086 length:708 start_codon:yes stop_codon:yes gene_type:complete
MNDLKTLFQDIKNIFKEEGVDTTDTKEVLEATIKAEETKEVVEDTTETTKEEMAETVKEKFEDIVLADGSVAVAEPDVSLGAAVVVSVDDEMVPAPDGNHELADGRVITTEGGVITAIEEAEAEAEEDLKKDEEEEYEVEKPLNEAQEREAKKIIESIVTERVFSMEATLSVENEELKSKITRLETAFKSLLDLTEKLVEKPTTETAKKKRSGFAKLKKEKKDIIEVLKSKNIIN